MRVIDRPPTFEAMQLTEENEAEVAAFVGASFRPSTKDSPAGIHDLMQGWTRPMVVGSWVVLTPVLAVILPPEEFAAKYIPAP